MIRACLVILAAALAAGCSKAPDASDAALEAQYLGSCRTNVAQKNPDATPEQVGTFCTCLTSKARLRYSAQQLVDGLHGAGPSLDKDLAAEVAACRPRS